MSQTNQLPAAAFRNVGVPRFLGGVSPGEASGIAPRNEGNELVSNTTDESREVV